MVWLEEDIKILLQQVISWLPEPRFAEQVCQVVSQHYGINLVSWCGFSILPVFWDIRSILEGTNQEKDVPAAVDPEIGLIPTNRHWT